MTPEERKARYEKAVAAREAAKLNQGGYSPQNIPVFEHVVLTQNSTQVIRLVGNSLETRSAPTDPLLVERSLMRADDDSYFNCTWSPERDWPLRKLLTKLAKYEYNEEDKKKKYVNEGCPLLKKFLTNGNTNNPFDMGMLPKKFVLFNAIDRKDSWCKENKHTKMVAWDLREKDGKKFYTTGLTQGLYKDIWNRKCSEIGHHFDEVDFVIHRYNEKTRPNEKTNYVVYWKEEVTPIKNLGTKEGKNIDYNKFIVDGYLTEEEEAYERYVLEDIPFISQVTPAAVILSKIGKFLKEVDAKYGTTIVDELTALKTAEIAALKEKTKNEEKDNFTNSKPVSSSASAPAEEPEYSDSDESSSEDLPGEVEVRPQESAPAPKATKVTKKAVGFVIPPEAYDHFGGLSDLSPEDKKKIIGINMENDEIKFSEDADVECGSCESSIPNSFSSCPFCGASFAE